MTTSLFPYKGSFTVYCCYCDRQVTTGYDIAGGCSPPQPWLPSGWTVVDGKVICSHHSVSIDGAEIATVRKADEKPTGRGEDQMAATLGLPSHAEMEKQLRKKPVGVIAKDWKEFFNWRGATIIGSRNAILITEVRDLVGQEFSEIVLLPGGDVSLLEVASTRLR